MRYITSRDIVQNVLLVVYFFVFVLFFFFFYYYFFCHNFFTATSFISAVKMQKGQSFYQISKSIIKDVDQGLTILMFIDQSSSKNINPKVKPILPWLRLFCFQRSHCVCYSLIPAKDFVFFEHCTVIF